MNLPSNEVSFMEVRVNSNERSKSFSASFAASYIVLDQSHPDVCPEDIIYHTAMREAVIVTINYP